MEAHSTPTALEPARAHVTIVASTRTSGGSHGRESVGAGGSLVETAAQVRIFISYRRDETEYPAGWLFNRLTDHFPEGQVFKDIDSIAPGDVFLEVITEAVGSCDVLLALIGSEWLTVTDADGAGAGSTTQATSSGSRSRRR